MVSNYGCDAMFVTILIMNDLSMVIGQTKCQAELGYSWEVEVETQISHIFFPSSSTIPFLGRKKKKAIGFPPHRWLSVYVALYFPLLIEIGSLSGG